MYADQSNDHSAHRSIEHVSHCTVQSQLLSALQATQPQNQKFVSAPFWKSMEWQRKPTTEKVQQDPIVKIAAANFEKFCKKLASQPQMDHSLPPVNPSIPAQIHFIWLGSPVSLEIDAVIDSWRDNHPGWGISVWTEKEANEILAGSERLLKAFQSADTLAEKSDILRLQILHKIGGIYADTDAVCLKPFHEVISQGYTFIGGIEMNFTWEFGSAKGQQVPLCLGSAVMASAPGSSVIQYCLDHYRTKEEAPSVGLVMRVGPGLVAKACYSVLSSTKEESDVLVLPCSYLYPFPFEEKAAFNKLESTMTAAEKLQSLANMAKAYIAPESLAVHLWIGSWLSDEFHLQLSNRMRTQYFGLDAEGLPEPIKG